MLFCFSGGYSALFETETKALKSEFTGEIPAFAEVWETISCTEDLQLKIYAFLPHFRGCDFPGARIFTDAAKQFLLVLCRTVP